MSRALAALSCCALCMPMACAPDIVIGYAEQAPDDSARKGAPGDAGAVGDTGDMGDPDAAAVQDSAVGDTRPMPTSDDTPAPVTWTTGAHTGNELAQYADFVEFRGRPLDVALFFVDRTTGWPGLVTPGWPIDMLEGFAPRLILAEPLYPEGAGDNAQCAAGAYDDEWAKLGPFLVERGRGDSIIRLGWGPNDAAHAWRADTDPSDWIECYRRVVDAIRAGGPDLEIAWDFNPAGRPDNTPLDPYAAYPGDAWVDYVGIEAFDHYPPTADETSWRARCDGPTGLCTLAAFAREHGKLLGVSEWGVVSCGDQGGGDSPFFVRKMFDLFADNADVMGYESYYEDTSARCSALSANADNPLAAAEYARLYGPR